VLERFQRLLERRAFLSAVEGLRLAIFASLSHTERMAFPGAAEPPTAAPFARLNRWNERWVFQLLAGGQLLLLTDHGPVLRTRT
jgi:hypothetical protein